jgi:alkyldihydroxyacetonephosphate synthase
MRRWNGWGEDSYSYPLPASAAQYLESLVGPGFSPEDISLADALASVPESRLPAHPLVSADPLLRLRHARGQSFPDLVAMRSGRIGHFPDGLAFPTTEKEVSALIDFAIQSSVRLIPYGGGTSVVGHINPLSWRSPGPDGRYGPHESFAAPG